MARQAVRQEGRRISTEILTATDWQILVTSLDPERFPTAVVIALCRLRWRIEVTPSG